MEFSLTKHLTISEGIKSFIAEFDFNGKKNTEKTYLRALTLFEEFIISDKDESSAEYRGLLLSSFLSDLPDSILGGYLAWLRRHPFPIEYRGRYKPPVDPISPPPCKLYSSSTIHLYEIALKRVLGFWRGRDWLSFNLLDQAEAQRSASTKPKTDRKFTNIRATLVPLDFGTIMLDTVNRIVRDLGVNSKSTRSTRLEAFRSKCLIHVLMLTGLRASDIAVLTVRTITDAQERNGYMNIKTIKSGTTANCYLNPAVLESINLYLNERGDKSPWLFIQHGKSNKKPDPNKTVYSKYTSEGKTRKGYGAPITPLTIWRIVRSVASAAGYKQEDVDRFTSPHALRHWFAQNLRDDLVPLDVIQASLGHSSLETTRAIYAPFPNLKPMVDSLNRLQDDNVPNEESYAN